MEIVIAPPFWQTTWAYLIYLVFIGIVCYFSFHIIRNFNRLRNRIAVEKQLTEYKLEFFTNISHEFRTPLTLIQGALNKLINIENPPKEMQRPLKTMDKSTQRMLRLINQLLEFRKMQKNKLALSLEETDVIAFLYEIFLSFKDTSESKNIDFSFMFQFQYGNDIYNATRMFNTQSQDERSNQLVEVADRWTPTHASNRVPSAKGYVKYELYSRFIEDGSFLRLKNITLGYTLPKKWTRKAYINRLRVYGTAQNLFCFTKYSGYDPEVNMKSSPLMPGFDWGAYPKSRVFTFGVEVQF